MKPAYFILTVVVALAALFAARQGTLNALRADNDSLRRRIDSATSSPATAVPDPPAEAVAGLSDAEERELLQLRSKIVPLREQLRDVSNRVVVLQRRQKDAASKGDDGRREK